jgi:hypothetical protein
MLNLLHTAMQVPFHLSQAIVSTSDPFAPRAFAATGALAVLWKKAAADGVLVGTGPYASPDRKLLHSFGQQLQQSGLMTALPQLLDAATAALSDTKNEPALAHVPQHEWYTLTAATVRYAAAAGRMSQVQSVTGQLLLLLQSSLNLWPQLVDEAAVFLPALRTSTAVLQYCSRCADLVSPDGPAPAALEELMLAACSLIKGVCAVWKKQVYELHGDGVAAWALKGQHPIALQAISMLSIAVTLCPQSWVIGTPAADNSDYTRYQVSQVPLHTPDSRTASQAAWQYACTHQSDLSELQQQALQALGCSSGRGLLYVAQHGLRSILTSSTATALLGATHCISMQWAMHWPSLPQLDQPQQVQQLAEGLAQLKEGDRPPCGSPLLPCAPLLWLMPAVMLEWAQKQAANGANTAESTCLFRAAWSSSMGLVHVHEQFWARACSVLREAARQQEQQGGATSSMLKAASRVAVGFSRDCQPPALHLVLLLQLARSAAAYMTVMACTQQSPGLPTSESSSPSSSSHCVTPDANKNKAGTSSRAGRGTGCVGGHGQQTQTGIRHAQALDSLLAALHTLCSLVKEGIWLHACATYGSMAGTESGSDAVQPASLASLCAAWQQTLPQLTSLTEAALRSGVAWVSKPSCGMVWPIGPLRLGESTMQELGHPVFLAAAGLQLGNPALKPLLGLATSLLKLAMASLAQPKLDQQAIVAAIRSLWAVVYTTALVVTAACSGYNSGSRSRPDAVPSILSYGKWEAGPLSEILSSSTSSTASLSTSDGSNTDAISFVPWLLSLGRCCMLYAIVLQQIQDGTAPIWQAAADSSQRHMRGMAQALQDVAVALLSWLQSSSVSAQLATAGYKTQRVIELLQSITQAGLDAPHAGAAVPVPPERLRELGLALSNLPVGTVCNNPRCSSLAGPSEQQLVMRRSSLCAGCLVARYCCRACQVAAWKQHKPACKAIASARAAKSAEQPA